MSNTWRWRFAAAAESSTAIIAGGRRSDTRDRMFEAVTGGRDACHWQQQLMEQTGKKRGMRTRVGQEALEDARGVKQLRIDDTVECSAITVVDGEVQLEQRHLGTGVIKCAEKQRENAAAACDHEKAGDKIWMEQRQEL